jgi:hypothetical protein
MPFATPNSPNLPDFLVFLTERVQVPLNALAPGSVWPGYAFDEAKLTVQCAWGVGVLYSIAVYNLATCLLFTIAPDIPNSTYFATQRTLYKIGVPITGLVVNTFDQGTGVSLVVPKWAAGLTPEQIALYNIPYGRAYLSYASKYGPNIVAIS